MPIPQPQADEDEDEFIGRCMADRTMMDDYPDQDQRLAVCFSTWEDAQDDGNRGLDQLRTRKATAAPPPNGNPFEFVMSDASVDRMGDVIEPDGWRLDNFRKNPIALFGHDSHFPIGTWRDVGVSDGRLTGRLELMDPVSDRLREVHAAVGAGVLRAVSVGFRALEYEPIEGSKVGGLRFLDTELVECSLVSVPANPNALAVAKALGISREGQRLIFGELAEVGHRSVVGSLARSPESLRRKSPIMNTLSDRIQITQTSINTMRDELTQLLAADEIDITAAETLNGRIEAEQRRLDTLVNSERALGAATGQQLMLTGDRTPPATTARQGGAVIPRPFAMPKKEEKPGHLLVRAAVVQFLQHVTKKSPTEIIKERYGDDVATREIFNWVTRAATAPAMTNVAGWAQELAQIQYGEWFDALLPRSLFGPLAPLGLRVTLGRFAQISMPTRQLTPTIAGAFVAEGAPIPVRQGAFTTFTLGLKKMAVITSYTREMAEHSTPMIETLLRQQIEDDTSIAIDTVLIDTNPATTIRPAGLRNGVTGLTPTTPTAGQNFVALVTDLKNLLAVLVAANSLRSPAWLMNPQQALSISLTQSSAGAGVFPFRDEVAAGRLLGYPLITSTTVPATMVILLDAADFVSLTGDDPRFELSDQTTLHMEDTNPQPIGTPGTPNVVAAPVRSMFQTDSIALRMILPMNWAMRRTGLVAWMTGVQW